MAELTVYASIDSYMDGVWPDLNFGSVNDIYHCVRYADGKSLWRRGIGNFDVSALSGRSINSAKLVRIMYGITNGGQSAKLSRCTRWNTWTEPGVTWDEFNGVDDWTLVGGDFDDTGPPAVITYTEATGTGSHEILGLKPFVEDALDNRDGIVSIITRLTDEAPETDTQYVWASKDYGSDIWHLVIDYTPAAVAGLPERGELRGVLRGVVRGY